jgi:hypothetical protein
MQKREYRGTRQPDGACLVTVDGQPLASRLDIINHSPTGFDWGYGGSGPAQLALAILADAFAIPDDQYFLKRADALAFELHHPFKLDVIAKLPRHHWTLTREFVLTWFRTLAPLAGYQNEQEDDIELSTPELTERKEPEDFFAA